MRLLKKSIRNEFLLMLFTLTITFLAIVIIFFLYIVPSNEKMVTEHIEVSEKAQIIANLEESYRSVLFQARVYYAFQDKQELNILYENLEQFEIMIEKFVQLPLTKEEKAIYTELVTFHQYYTEVILPNAIIYVEDNNYEALREITNKGMDEFANKFLAYTRTYNEQTEIQLKELYSKTIEQTQQFTLLSLFFYGVVLCFAGLIIHRMTFNLIHKIERLKEAANAISSGDFVNQDSFDYEEDELGVLANSFYKMTQSIQEKEEVLTSQNEELLAGQYELKEQQEKLELSLSRMRTYNQLSNILTYTLDKQQLLEDLHTFLNERYEIDTSILYLLESKLYVSKGLTKQTATSLVEKFDKDKQARLVEEKTFVITREISPKSQDIAQQAYYVYDLYSSVLNSEGKLVAVMMATREGNKYSKQEIQDINGLMNQVSIAFERIFMYEEMEKSRQLNQNIIDSVNEGIQFVATNEDVILINKMLSHLIQWPANENNQMIAQSTWLKYFEAIVDQPEELITFFEQAVAEDFKDTRTLRYSITENTPVFIEVYATSLYEDFEKIGTVFVHRDITREYEVDRMKSELVSTVSHELRTPLSSVLGFTELLLTRELKQDRQKKYLEIIHKEAERLTNLVSDFLDIQRMESGKQQYNMEQLYLDELANEIVNMFLHEPNHKVHIVDKVKNVNITGDKAKIVQVFINIIGNAIKFSPNGGDVTIKIENNQDMAIVSIKDKGMGIPKKDLPNVFEKFKQIDSSARRKIGGTGLGLPICKEIIKNHNGDIWIESIEGQGTTVYFTLPLSNKISSI